MSIAYSGLTPLYLNALNGNHSFIKSINPGTGLGKTYSAFDAINEYIMAQEDKTPHVFIYTAPQHNQIIIDDKTVKKLAENQCELITVLPVSEEALSNIDSAMNAYQIAKDLFLTPRGSHNSLFKALSILTKRLDKQHSRRENEIPFYKRLKTIGTLTALVQMEQRRRPLTPSITSTKTMDSMDQDEALLQTIHDSLYEENHREEAERSALKIQTWLREISQHLTKLCEYSYSNPFFYEAIEHDKTLKEPSRKKWRTITASFYPFLHIQKKGSRYSLLTMTVAKMMTRHKIFVPKKRKGAFSWHRRDARINDLVTDKSPLIHDAIQLLEEAKQGRQTQDNYAHFFKSNFVFFIDESDAAKAVITDKLSYELKDKGVIQAIGAFAKETADVVANNNHVSVAKRLEESEAPDLLSAVGALHNNDALARIVAKEYILLIRNKIYNMLIQKKWVFACKNESVNSLFKKTNLIFTGSLTAPYCVIAQSINAEIFKTTSAFGGEMYGFTGSSKINDLSFVNMGNSFSIMTKEASSRLPSHHKSVPLAYFFLLLTEMFLYFRLISKDSGSVELDRQHASEFNAFIANNDAIGFFTYMHSFHKKKKGALSGIGAPFRNSEMGHPLPFHRLHTVAAQDTIKKIKAMIMQEHFQNAFSDNKELIDLINDDIHTFSAPKPSPIDLHFANKKGHTVYGMAQVYDMRYPITSNSHHVVFPLIFRAQSAEQYIVNLVDTKTRKNGVFLMSATGGFKKNHISAFSLETLELLLNEQKINAKFLTMCSEEYKCVAAAQQARKAKKKLTIKFFDHTLNDFPVDINCNEVAKNKYKKNELMAIHWAFKQVSKQKKPYFSLTLAQTHRHFTNYMTHLSQQSAPVIMTHSEQRQEIECLLASPAINTVEGAMAGAGYAIYLVHAAQKPSTLVVCYAAALDKALTLAFLNQDTNPYKAENRLKRALGLAEGKAAPLADSQSINPMDYLLNEHHGHHVLIVSAYQSAARGINLIVNNSPLISRLNKNKGKLYKKRDLDALFICAVPYYSELKTAVSTDSLHPEVAQQRFFEHCRKYFYRIEELARRSIKTGRAEYSSDDVDLFIAHNDPIQAYFLDQHYLALMGTLMQGVGRIERTDAAQEQYLYITEDVRDIVQNGMEAARRGLTRIEQSQIRRGLSMVNAALFNQLLSLDTLVEETKQKEDFTPFESRYLSQAEHFEETKTELLNHCQSLRNEIEQTVSLALTPFIHFYECFRSGILWEQGRKAYIKQLYEAIEQLPVSRQSEYHTFVDQLFITMDSPLPSYQTRIKKLTRSSTRTTKILSDHYESSMEDLDAMYHVKNQASVNPYYEYDATIRKHVYAAPWFLADMAGNYGEMVLRKALNQLSSNLGFSYLKPSWSMEARQCYEYADFFVQYKKRVVG